LATPLGTRSQSKEFIPPSALCSSSSYHYFPSFHTRSVVNTAERLTPANSNLNLQNSSYLMNVTVAWNENTTSCIIISIHSFIHSSVAKQAFAGPWLLQFYTKGRTPWTGDQPVARLLPTHKTTQTKTKRTHRHPWLQ
jgi:hypothetical protein